MKFFNVAAAAAMAISMSSTVSAQNLQLNQAPTVMESATTQWVTNLFRNVGFTTAVVEETAASDTIQVTVPGGGTFYTVVRNCDGAVPKNCTTIEPFILFDGTGVVLSQLNEAVRDHLIVSHAVLLADGNGALASKIILAGGVAEGNVIVELGAFFEDTDRLFAAINSGPRADVNFDVSTQSVNAGTSKIKNGVTNSDYVVNKVGPNAPKFLTDETKALFD